MNNRVYFGKVAPTMGQKKQLQGGGWSWRYQVRIMDKHPHSKDILPDKDLPWAMVLLPVTAGSGAAGYSQTPAINQGDTVSISYLDNDEQIPIITGILPRTEDVSTAEPNQNGDTGFIPSTGYTETKPRNDVVPSSESNENNAKSQPSPPPEQITSAVGTVTTLADTTDPNAYKTNAVISEMNNLLSEIKRFSDDASRIESMVTGTIDRVHSLVNGYVGEMFNNLFNSLQPVLNAGLKALYDKVFSIVLASTGNPLAALAAAQAALIALQPAVLALQEAIQILANEVVSGMLEKVDDLVRDTVTNVDNFTSCAGTQFNGALINSIINDIDVGIFPLISAVASVLSGGFNAANAIRSSIDIVRDFSGGLLAAKQSANKASGLVKEYVIGVGPKEAAGDILSEVLDAANQANVAIEEVTGIADTVNDITRQFGDFPFISGFSNRVTQLSSCSFGAEDTLFAPEVRIFGGRGTGAKATAFVGRYVDSDDGRTVTNKKGGVISIKIDDGGEGYVYPPFVEIRDNGNVGRGANARAVIKDGKVDKIYIVSPGEGYPSQSDGPEPFVVEQVEIISGGEGYVPGEVEDEYGGRYELIVDTSINAPITDPSDTTGIGTETGTATGTPSGTTPSGTTPSGTTPSGTNRAPGTSPLEPPIGRVIAIRPINLVQVPDIPNINIPDIVPPLPPGGIIIPEPKAPTPQNPSIPSFNPPTPTGNVFDSSGKFVGKSKIGKGLKFRPIIVPAPTAEQIIAGEVSENVTSRLLQEDSDSPTGISDSIRERLQTEVVQVIDCVED